MHWSLQVLIGLSALAISPLRAVAQQSLQPTAVQRYGQLSVKGNTIVDQHGQPVTLRGMSLFWSQWGGQFYNPDCIKWLRDDWHCTVIRAALGVGSGGYLEHPEVEQKRIETVIKAAIDLGIYVIVDWHAHDPETTAAQKFFSEISAKYGKYPNIIYETWNEPIHQDWSKVIKPYHEAVIAKIRENDTNNLIICGSPLWSQSVEKAAADPIPGTNIAYTLHFYAASHKKPLRDQAKSAMEHGIALMVTEWGTCEASGNGKLDEIETKRWLNFLDEHHISSCNWSVIDKDETAAALKPGASPNGQWTPEMISPSGKIVREAMRSAKEPTVTSER